MVRMESHYSSRKYGATERSESSETLGAHFPAVELNPCAGPIFVEGARAGDVLVAHFHDIVVDDQGVTALLRMWGPFKDSATYAECRGPYTRIIRHLPGPRRWSALFRKWGWNPLCGAMSPLHKGNGAFKRAAELRAEQEKSGYLHHRRASGGGIF